MQDTITTPIKNNPMAYFLWYIVSKRNKKIHVALLTVSIDAISTK